jgi:hypothetical protein
MKNRFAVYLVLGIFQIISGLLGSYFVFVVSGAFMLFKALSEFARSAKTPLRIIICSVFALLDLYCLYYSFIMLISQIDYAAFRPATWIVIPIAVTLITLIALFVFSKDAASDPDTTDNSAAIIQTESSIEDLTVFVLIFIGWIGTFVFEFFFEYSAAFCIAVCLLKNVYKTLFPKQTKTTTTQLSEQQTISPVSDQPVKET